jgi:hypothetical protein
MVLDSPFSSLHKLFLELAQTKSKIPSIIVKLVLRFIRKSVLSRAKFDIERLNPIDHVKRCVIPVTFIIAKGDDLVRPSHSEDLFKLYSGDKNLIRVEGDHNTDRPNYLHHAIASFFSHQLQA